MDYTSFASDLIAKVGGKDNIISVANCMTRLRFVLKDFSKADKEALKATSGVMGVVEKGGQLQLIIGTQVAEICPVVQGLLNEESEKTAEPTSMEQGKAKAESMRVVKKDSWYNRFFKTISGCILPAIAPMAASGIIKGVLVILTTFGVLASTDGTYVILYAAADALMYFFPIFVGFSAGKVFGMNQYTAAVIGAAMLYPNLAAYVGESLTFLTIPVTMLDYSQTVLPIILTVWIASYIEKWAKKVLPQVLQLMFVPTIVLCIAFPLCLLVTGPVMTAVSNALATGINALYNAVPVLCGGVLGAFWQLFVMMGIHSAMIPIIINNLTVLGYCPINAILGLTVWALAGVALGFVIKVKDKNAKSAGSTALASALCGITEPAIYMVALTNFKRFVAAFIGGGIAGALGGALGIKFYNWGGDGIFRIPSMINPAGLDISFYGFLICAAIAFVVSGIISYIVTDKNEKLSV